MSDVIADLPPEQVLSPDELDSLRAFKDRYQAQGLMEAAGSGAGARAGGHLLFMAWLYETGRIGGRTN